VVLPLAYRRDRWTDSDAQYVIRRGSGQGSAFWGLENLNLIFNLFSRKIQKVLQWRLWGKFKNSSNCHNFGCIQHRVVIFGSRHGFRGRPIQRCHFNLPPTDPCWYGNEIWDKIGYNSACVEDISEILASYRGFSGSTAFFHRNFGPSNQQLRCNNVVRGVANCVVTRCIVTGSLYEYSFTIRMTCSLLVIVYHR